MKESEVHAFLHEAGVVPNKSLGQNFLTDSDTAKWLADQLIIRKGDTVVEVGPGTGSITDHLLPRAEKLILIEFDNRLARALTEKFADNEKVTVHHADAAQFDTRTLFADSPIRLIGNLPYSAGGAIMRNFLERPSPVEQAVLMLQKEVIDRMCAVPRTKDYSVLSLRTQSEWDVEAARVIGPDALHPRPRIDSTVAILTRRRDPLPPYDDRLFDSLIRRAFSQRRKQMRKQLPATDQWEEVAEEIGFATTARAEELSLEQWIELTNFFDPNPLKNNPQKGSEIFDVVDMDDQVTGQERRDVVHRDDLLHRAVHILVFNKKKEVFLQKRSRLKDKCPNLWDSSAAGHLNAGDDYEPTAIRELKEELGVDAEVQEILRLTPSENTGWEHIALYLARHDGAVTYPCSEVETGMWLSMEELDRWMQNRPQSFAPGFVECWLAFRQKMAG